MTSVDSVPIKFLSYATVRERFQTSLLRRSEIPTEHSVSLALPTRRWAQPAFAFFASPAQRTPGRPLLQAPPDRFWAFAAHGGHLVLYALTSAISLAPEAASWQPIELPPPTVPVAKLRDEVAVFDEVMTIASEDFFQGRPATASDGLVEAWARLVPPPVLPFYRALAPDFWQWLGR